MAEPIKPPGGPPTSRRHNPKDYEYPFAAAPDIIRSHQKDAYFQGVVLEHISDLLRRVYGARFLHHHTSAARMFSDLLYLGSTTLLGNRTLGEEYCDMVQVEDRTVQLPSLHRRAGYIMATVLLPYWLTRVLPSFRQRLRLRLEANLRRRGGGGEKHASKLSASARAQAYLLAHLDSVTSTSSIYSVNLAVFYFTGAYYEIGKRLWGLRYIFTRRIAPSEQRVGYEVLGFLMALQIVVQGWLHISQQLGDERSRLSQSEQRLGQATGSDDDQDVVGKELDIDTKDSLLYFTPAALASNITRLERITHTPRVPRPRYDLHEKRTMEWIEGRQQRKCTLCLEEMRDPSATTCGHVFCWSCIGDWCREKPECPLCRQACLPQHILPIRDKTGSRQFEQGSLT
ncbi:MAG: peroxisome biogenesis factor 10 [Peltula sp. TS41687]|nr:MAG: peroxisome biogenesis factor 10 [Peltula sp. TS41687]